MKEYSRYKYNIQDNNPPSPLLLTTTLPTIHIQTHAHTHTYEQIRTRPGCSVLMQQGQWKVTETLSILHTDYKPDGMLLLLRHRTCFSVCVYESEWVSEWVRMWRLGRHVAVTGLQDGVGVQVEGEVERMAELLLSHSVSLGGMGGAQSQCVTTEQPLSLSLFLSLAPSSLTSWSRQCVSQASVLCLQLWWKATKTRC